MRLYAEHVLPRIVDLSCGSRSLRRWRERVCADLSGEVVEVGFGSGHNTPHYPPAVTAVTAVEPSELAWRLAQGRVARTHVEVRRAGLDGQQLPFPDASFDSALSTFTLCTIADPVAALREVRRVLRPGGRLHALEHGLAPDPGVRRWQARLTPLQRRVAGGCRLDLPIDEIVAAAGFTPLRIQTGYAEGAPKPFGFLYELTAL